jgi:hypothetical protein
MTPLEIRQKAEQRMAGLRSERTSFWSHWKELADYILPRRYKWLITANQSQRGSPINNMIIDSTGTMAARICSSGMMSGLTSPTRPWFKLAISGFTNGDTSHPVSIWLSEVEKRLSRVFSVSNFYNSTAIVFQDLVVFGTAAFLMYEDYEDVIRCYNPCLGEYFLQNGARMEVNVFAREFVRTLPQIAEEFGYENMPKELVEICKKGGADTVRERVLCHMIEPNTGDSPVPKKMKYREIYWLRDGTDEAAPVLRIRGFNELPGMFPRWDIFANDAYGRSPGMDALSDIKQLQQEQKRKAQAIDKMVNPPLVADVQLKNQPASLLPGGITYIAGQNNVGMKPVFHVNPPVQELMEDIKEVQGRVKEVFFNDLFMMISQLETVRTATEIDARREEKLVQLGPVIERFENEFLSPAITRVFNIMQRGNLLPPAPPEISGKPIEIEYVSMLAEAQKAVATSAIERVMQITGNFAAVDPHIVDKLDTDEALDQYATLLGTNPKIIRSAEAVKAIRDAKAKAEQQQQAAEMTPAAVQGAKVLSQTEVGGGQNALAAAMGQGQ